MYSDSGISPETFINNFYERGIRMTVILRIYQMSPEIDNLPDEVM